MLAEIISSSLSPRGHRQLSERAEAMGNASSNQQQQQAQAHLTSPRASRRMSRSPAPAAHAASTSSPSPTPNNPHRSLRQKKKSLELPDLASLALSPSAGGGQATPGGGRRATVGTSSPIPIPMSPAHQQGAPAPARAPRALPSQSNLDELLNAPAHPGARAHFRGGPLPYSSTRSFRDAPPPPRPAGPAAPAATANAGPAPPRPIEKSLQVHPTVASGLPNPLGGADGLGSDGTRRKRDRPVPVPYKVVWRGHAAQSVVLARAGDSYWKGRQPMEKE
jgi:hypothetical protein